MLRIAIAQTNVVVGDLPGNSRKILSYIQQAKRKGVDIVVFPEIALCGYPPEDLLFKEHFVQDNLKCLRKLAKKVSGITAIMGFVDVDAKKNLYNAAAIISEGRVKGVYHKKHLPNYGVFDEKRYFTPGEKDLVLGCGKAAVGVSICEDIWEEKRICGKNGAVDVFINISGSPYDLRKLAQREKMLIQRAKSNHVYICYANLIGGQDELVFDGGSLIISPQGHVIASGEQFKEDLIIADLETMQGKKKKRAQITVKPAQASKKKNVARHISKPLSEIERIYRALVLGTRDYILKNGFEKVVVGLSGGIDSSLVATIACEAIGAQNVVGISMPSVFTSQETKSDAQKLAEKLRIKFIQVPIDQIFGVYVDVLKKDFAGREFDKTEENIQARIRGNLLMAFSNKFGWLVLTTGNKSEVAVGYCTLYGDLSGGFAVIKDVPKTIVYDVARFVNEQKNGIIPESILTRAPTAELKENQKDQDALPPYEVLDPLLKAYVEDHQSLVKRKKINAKETDIKDIINLIDRSEYKRRQSPPGIKITPRAFGKDWRLPITNRYKEF